MSARTDYRRLAAGHSDVRRRYGQPDEEARTDVFLVAEAIRAEPLKSAIDDLLGSVEALSTSEYRRSISEFIAKGVDLRAHEVGRFGGRWSANEFGRLVRKDVFTDPPPNVGLVDANTVADLLVSEAKHCAAELQSLAGFRPYSFKVMRKTAMRHEVYRLVLGVGAIVANAGDRRRRIASYAVARECLPVAG